MNSLEILDTAVKRKIYARNNHSYITIRLTQLLALYLTRSEQCRLASTRTNPSYKLTDPSGPLWFAFRKSKKNYSRWNSEPICIIYYAAAQRNSLREPLSLAVNLVRNIKPRLVFANHRNKQPHVTRAWRHGKHRYNGRRNNLELLVPSLPTRIFYISEICHVTSGPQSDTLVGAYHLARKSGNFGLKSNGKVVFRKFRSEIVEYLQRYSSFPVRNETAEISLPFAKLSSFKSLISRKQLREIEAQMVSAISFGWFADFGKTLTIIQRTSQPVYSNKW